MLVYVLFLSLLTVSCATEKKKEEKSLKQEFNETANQVDSGVRKAIKEVKTLVKPKEKKP